MIQLEVLRGTERKIRQDAEASRGCLTDGTVFAERHNTRGSTCACLVAVHRDLIGLREGLGCELKDRHEQHSNSHIGQSGLTTEAILQLV
jgi:hypothetical protein